MTKISVIIPVYKTESYIERCARSLFEQTLDDIEYIFVDDCTPDHSIDVLRNVIRDYPNRSNIIIHRMQKNSGQAEVRKWGIQHATGEYTIHCDSDDWVDTSAYKLLYEKAKESDCDIVFHDYYIYKDNTPHYKSTCGFNNPKEKLVTDILQARMKASLWMALIKRSIFDDNRFSYPKGDMTEDFTIILQAIVISNKISHISSGLYYYCYNNQSISHKITREACLKRFQDCVSNTDLLQVFLEKVSVDYSEELDVRKLDTINQLLPAVYKREYLRLWKSKYPRLTLRLLHSKLLNLSEKIKILMIYCGLYPVYQLIKGYEFAK